MWRKGNPCVLLVGMLIGAAIIENSMEFPQKLKIELPYDPAIPLLIRKDMCTPMFIAALFTIAKI